MKIKINNKIEFNKKKAPLLIAEVSGNHSGSKKKFLKLINSAFLNGADLVKIQTYEPIDITLNKKNDKFKIKNGIWKNRYLWDLYKEACTPFNWHEDAFKMAKKHNKILFSSPFSIRAVDLLESFNVKIYKISSFELTDYKLIDYIASKKKPIIISTGMANYKEIKNAIRIIEKYHKQIIILHCVSNYPTKLEDTSLASIKFLKKKFNKYLIGLSDHTKDIISCIATIPLGIVAIEKHFKIDDNKTTDSEFSINSEQLNKLKISIKALDKSLNKRKITFNKQSTILRRSIFATKNLFLGDKLNYNNMHSLRPKIGIPAENYFKLIGKKINKNIKKDHPIYLKDLD